MRKAITGCLEQGTELTFNGNSLFGAKDFSLLQYSKRVTLNSVPERQKLIPRLSPHLESLTMINMDLRGDFSNLKSLTLKEWPERYSNDTKSLFPPYLEHLDHQSHRSALKSKYVACD